MMEVFHGSSGPIWNWNKRAQTSGYYPGFYTTTNKDHAMGFGACLYRFEVDPEKLFQMPDDATADRVALETARELNVPARYIRPWIVAQHLEGKGFLGIQRGEECIIFDPEVAFHGPPSDFSIATADLNID